MDCLDKIIFGDATKEMKNVPDNSVHMVLTSPPYPGVPMWDGIWKDWTFAQQHDWLDQIWKESLRVLVPGGRLIINIMDPPVTIGVVQNSSETTLRCIKMGFDLKENIIWDKGRQHSAPSGSWPYPWGLLVSCTHEYILVFKKPGKRDTSQVSDDIKKKSILNSTEHAWKAESVWKIKSASAKKEKHIAPYPMELPTRCIRLWSFVGDTILDPFAGSGTTCLAAKDNGRHYLGFEVDQTYYDLCMKNMTKRDMFGEE